MSDSISTLRLLHGGIGSATRWAACLRKYVDFQKAEEVGFEPTRRLPAYRISSAAPSSGLGDSSAAESSAAPGWFRQRDSRQ